MLTERELIAALRDAVSREKTQKDYAQQHGISEQYLSDVLRGKREPGQKILEALGVERVVSYRKIDVKS